MNKRNIIISIIVILLLIVILWISGIIPKKIAQVSATNYLKNNFPKIQLEYDSIEWSSNFGGYIIKFKDDNNETYSFIMNNKYFPITLGQGLFGFEENYREKYENNSTEKFNTTTSYNLTNTNISNSTDNESSIVVEKTDRSPNNVIIDVQNDTISPETITIIITDNNKEHYGWGMAFRIQEKNNGKWNDLKYVSDDLAWIEIAYELNEDNKLTQKLNIEKYYGKLKNGIYRVVKPVYDNEYIDIYSNEFEIK